MRESYVRAELEVLELGFADIVTASEPTTESTGPNEVLEQIPSGIENMQGGGTSGIDWNN